LAEATGAKLIWGDLLLRVETTYKLAAGLDWTAGSFKQRLVSAADSRLVAAGAGEILSEEVKTVVANAVRHNERTFVLASRRGLAPMVICVDCDELVQCQNCHTPMVLHESRVKEGIRETNIFRCHKCGLTRTSAEKCQFCGSWRLKELGLGIERVAEALAASFPELKIYQLDSDRVASRSRAEALVKKFLAAPGAVLLGTEMALYYLKEKVENGLAVGVDGLLALPDFRVREKLFRSLSRLRSLASKNFAIQTRQPDSILFGQIAAGNLSDFYREEIRDRKELSYPPFRLFIKITLAGTESAVAAGVAKLSESLAEYEPVSFAAFPPKVGRTYRSHLLLRLSPGAWPEPRLVERLRALPPAITVTVDPETLT
jgi:primosomal protein N' (replication factor Y)